MPHLTIDSVQALHRAGHIEEAKAGYLALLLENPRDGVALHLLGLLYAEENQLNEAEKCLKKASELIPNDPAILLHLANILKAKKAFKESMEVLLMLRQSHPHFAAADNNLGALYFLQENWKEAIAAFQSAIQKQANYVDAYYNLGLALQKVNKPEEACVVYQALLEIAPTHAGGCFQLGCIKMSQAKFSDAIGVFSKVIEKYPFHFETLTNLATCFLRMGSLVEAKKYYLRALQLTPSDTQILFNLGVIEMQQGRIDDAIYFYTETVKLSQNDFDAHNNLAFVYLIKKNIPYALLHFQEALRIKPHDKAILHMIHILKQEKNMTTSPPEYIRALFDSYANHYDAHLVQSLHYQVPTLMLDCISQQFQNPHFEKVLDLGCGTGLNGELLKPFSKKIIGIDLSSKMLEMAAKKNCYDALIESDMVDFLKTQQAEYDLAVAADVLVYSGALQDIFASVKGVLKLGGLFIFNTEISKQEDFVMTASGRFAHHQRYIDQLLVEHHFAILHYQTIPLRTQAQKPVLGHLYLVQAV